jgi:hypothetical protein
VPGVRSSTHGARYRVQSSVSRSRNLSSPKTIGATVNTVLSIRKAWWAGSRRHDAVVPAEDAGESRRVMAAS